MISLSFSLFFGESPKVEENWFDLASSVSPPPFVTIWIGMLHFLLEILVWYYLRRSMASFAFGIGSLPYFKTPSASRKTHGILFDRCEDE